jgi:hypothetical protein
MARKRFSVPATAKLGRSNAAASRFDRADADPLGLRRVLTQALHDLYGTKDVQDAITASYVWMADQIGHITLGLVPTLLVCWLFASFHLPKALEILLFMVSAGLIFSYWVYKEKTDYDDTKQRAQGIFPFDSADIVWNIKTALLYFGIGGLFGLTAFVSPWLTLLALAAVLYPALRVAFWWLRRKVAFQQAGLPYLYRLANFAGICDPTLIGPISTLANLKDRKVVFLDVLLGRDPVPDKLPGIRHMLVTGALGAGKTSLAVGIGTEFAFALGIGRYLTAAKLVQLATDAPGPAHELETGDGRLLWPWRETDLLIVDDVDAGATPPPGSTKPPAHLVEPADMEAALDTAGGPPPLAFLAQKRTVWVLGDASDVAGWKAAIARLMDIKEDEIVDVALQGVGSAAPVVA